MLLTVVPAHAPWVFDPPLPVQVDGAARGVPPGTMVGLRAVHVPVQVIVLIMGRKLTVVTVNHARTSYVTNRP